MQYTIHSMVYNIPYHLHGAIHLPDEIFVIYGTYDPVYIFIYYT